jgi:hypothetical protein
MRGTIPDSIGNLTALTYVLLQSCDIVLESAVVRDACQLACALRETSARNDVTACVPWSGCCVMRCKHTVGSDNAQCACGACV